MPILDKNNKNECKRLDAFFRNSEYSNYEQSFEFGKFKENVWKTEYVYLEQNGKIVAGALILIRTVAKVFNIMYMPKGPIMDIYNKNLMTDFLKEVEPLAKKYNAFVLKMVPEIEYTDELVDVCKDNKLKVRSEFKSGLEHMQVQQNMVLDIKDKSEQQVLESFNQKTRYNVRLAERKGVTTRYSNSEEDLKKFFELMRITAIRDGISLRPYEYFKSLIEIYKDNARIYFAMYEGIEIAAALQIIWNDRVIYYYGASANENRNVMPCYKMQYDMIKWAIEEKCNYYDFGGISKKSKEDGLYRFKVGFTGDGGYKKYIGEIDKVYKPFKYYLFTKIMPIAKGISFKIYQLKNKKND